jgi:hypothetical protein
MGERLFASTVTKKLWAVALLLCLAPFLFISLYTHPFYDDYCHAAQTLKFGVLGAVRHMYATWNGKYFSTLLLSLHPTARGSLTLYRIVAPALILLSFAAVYLLVSVLLKGSVAAVDKLIAAAFFTALYLNQMPEVTEGYYWLPGALTYLPGAILTTVFFALALKLFESVGRKRLLYYLLCCLLVAAIAGASETMMVIFFLLMLSITVKTFVARDQSRWVWLSFLLLTTVCGLVVALAPGNSYRSKMVTGQHRFFYSLLMSGAQEARFLLKWFTNPAFILGTILFIPAACALSESNTLLKRHFNFHPLVALLLLLAIVFLGFFPAYWATGLLGQHRTVNLVFFLFLLGWFLNLLMWTSYLRGKFNWRVASLPRYVYVICLLSIPLCLLTTNNTRGAIDDLASGRAVRYDRQMRGRYLKIQDCLKTGRSPCTIDTLTDLPTTITSAYIDSELECDNEYWQIELKRPESK